MGKLFCFLCCGQWGFLPIFLVADLNVSSPICWLRGSVLRWSYWLPLVKTCFFLVFLHIKAWHPHLSFVETSSLVFWNGSLNDAESSSTFNSSLKQPDKINHFDFNYHIIYAQIYLTHSWALYLTLTVWLSH